MMWTTRYRAVDNCEGYFYPQVVPFLSQDIGATYSARNLGLSLCFVSNNICYPQKSADSIISIIFKKKIKNYY